MKKRQQVLSARQEALAGKVAAVIIRRQMQVAGYLNRKTAYWNRSAKLTALALFCLVFGGLSLYLIIHAIH